MESSDFISNKRSISDLHDEHMNKKIRTDTLDTSDDTLELKLLREIKHEKFNTVICFYELTLDDLNINTVSDALSAVDSIFQTIIDGITAEVRPSDTIQLSFQTPSLKSAVHLPAMKCSALTVNNVKNQIEEQLQYNANFGLEKKVSVTCVRVRLPEGGVRTQTFVDLEKTLQNKKSVIRIDNNDKLCCARALVTAQARIEKHPKWNNIRKGRDVQEELAKELHKRAGVEQKMCDIPELKKFQEVMPQYQIFVLSKDHFDGFIYEGIDGGIPIYLYLHDNHYDVITSMSGFLNRVYYCHTCKKGYNNKHEHKCNNPCLNCRKTHDKNEAKTLKHCEDCNRNFINDTCFELHKEKNIAGKSTCNTIYKCKTCLLTINNARHKKEHVCGERYCKTCKDFYEAGHQCYMRPIHKTSTADTSPTKYIFVAFQSTQDEVIQCDKGYVPDKSKICINCKRSVCGIPCPLPNLCVVHKVCDTCLDNDVTNTSTCSSCGQNKRIFRGRNSANMLCKWLFSTENRYATVLYHELTEERSSHFLRYLYDNGYQPKVISSGANSIIEVPKCKLRIIDSQNFIPVALSDMAKSFDEKPLQEGFFPILFNTRDNQKAVLNGLPDIHFYNVEDMNHETKHVFQSWYHNHRNDHFNFQDDLLRYCERDVDIQRRCCLKFRTMIMDISKSDKGIRIDPFSQGANIASVSNTLYRAKYLEPDSIAIIPHEGYKPEETHSVSAYQWLSYIANKRDVFIQHARNFGERRIGPYRVDGFYERDDGQKYVLEFNGCYWHGCPECFSRDTVNKVNKSTMDALYTKTMNKQAYFEKHGYIYESIWECDYKTEVKKCPEMANFITSLDIMSSIQPKDAFYGCRTEGFKLLATVTEQQQIKYYDIASLYTDVSKTGKVPLGHPTIITEGFKNIENYEGLVKCKILPPSKLYMPVLPVKMNGEVVYSLCRTCSAEHLVGICTHNEADRAITGTWVTDEVKLAIAHGYSILKVYEIWHFERVSQYDQETKTDGAFTGYVNSFLKLKQEASGWSKWCKSSDDKERYIASINKREGIMLDYENIRENLGLRESATLMLDLLWDSFIQRPINVCSVYITDPSKYYELLTLAQIDVICIRFVNDETIRVEYVYKDNFSNATCQSNAVVAAYMTAQARIRLHATLVTLGRRTIYCDKDTIAFTHTPGQLEPPLVNNTGDFIDKVEDNRIVSFTTLGPQMYAYDLTHPDKYDTLSVCKIRGCSMRLKSTLNINGQTMKGIATCCKQSSDGHEKKSSLKLNLNTRFLANDLNTTYPCGF